MRSILRIVLGSVAVLSAFASLVGCGGERDGGRSARIAAGEVVVNLGGDPRTLDPGLVTDVISSQAINPFMRGLTSLGPRGEVRPELAESWTVSEDGLVYEFKLRRSLWTDGTPVVAGDFAYAWTNRMLDPKFAAEYAYLLFAIRGARAFYEAGAGASGSGDAGDAVPDTTASEATAPDAASVGVEAVGDDILRATLESPTPYFPQLVALHAFFPVNRAREAADPQWATRAESFVGNGPFRMTSYEPGVGLEGERNPGYWNAANVGMNRITLRTIADSATEALAFEAGEIDATAGVPRARIDHYRDVPGFERASLVGTYYLNFEMRDPPPALADPRVRRALALAIDRGAIIEHVTRAGELPALAFVPPVLWGDAPPVPTVGPPLADAAFDEARALLAEAGFPRGEGLPKFAFLFDSAEEQKALVEVVQETWRRELGVEVEPSSLEYRALIERRREGAYDVARNYWIADFLDPINFLEVYTSDSGNNASHWSDSEFDALVDGARREPDPARRLERLREAEARLMQVLPIVPIYHHALPYLRAPELSGYAINPMNAYDAAEFRWATSR